MRLSAKEEAFCKQQKILPNQISEKNRPKLTDWEISLIKQIYASYHELLGAYGDKIRFYNGFYERYIQKFGAEKIPIKYDPKIIDFSAEPIDILKEIAEQIQYFQQEAFVEMKTHMDVLAEGELYAWLIKLKNTQPAGNSVLLLKVHGFELSTNLNTHTFAEGVNDLKKNPSKNICCIKQFDDERIVWLAFVPDLHSSEELRKIASEYYGSPNNTDITWI